MKINEIVTEGKGLWANIHAKRNRIKSGSGEKMRKPGSKGAPTSQNFKDAASESMEQPAKPDSKFNSMMSKMTSKGALDTREATAMMFDLIHEQGASYSEALQQASVSYEIDPVELKAAYQKIQGTNKQGVAESIDDEDLANEVYAEFERIYPNLARKANEHSVRAAIIDVLNYGGDSNPSALAQDVARAVKRDIQQDVTESILEESYDGDEFYEAYGDLWYDEEQLNEAEYQGRKVQLGKPMQGDVKKFKVFVKNEKGNVVKVNFGDKNMRIRKSNPGARKSFRARHNCDNPGPRTSARYWSCRKW